MPKGNPSDNFPLHCLVWHNNYDHLERELVKDKFLDVELVDPRGRTALHLAVALGHLESTRVLLRHKAIVNVENKQGWTVLQEAISTGDPELVQIVLQHRDYQRASARVAGIPELLEKLRAAPDFYVEMKWEFTSWVPLVSRMCPSDVYRVYKSGASVRVDTTLLGFDQMTWQRGSRSYIFKGEEGEHLASFMEIDHDRCQVYVEKLQLRPDFDLSLMTPRESTVVSRLTSPVVTTYIDTEKIAFSRNKSGIWGWRSDKVEAINGYDCKVFSASNVELVTKQRLEHLTEEDKERNKDTFKNHHPLQSFLGLAEQHQAAAVANVSKSSDPTNPTAITPEEYFDPNFELGERDIGRPKETSTKVQKFKATLWLCEDHPLSLQEQVLPIIDLMAISNVHFAKLRDFITLQLPAGFPVKIEIPLFHILNARITFGNLNATQENIPGVLSLQENGTSEAGEEAAFKPITCVVDASCFEPPATYSCLGDTYREPIMRDEDDDLLQFAIQQSLLDAGTENDQVTVWEALNNSRPGYGGHPRSTQEERMLQRAIQESLRLSQEPEPSESDNPTRCLTHQPLPPTSLPPPLGAGSDNELDHQLKLALELSEKELKADEVRRKQEQEELEMILQLSLTEK
ncbi:LOW QUALITY PROTEIN: ankyrin repeat domain-containing protein 13D-like [Saccoglossus kowalevskii]|uniref:LOW QUALITY PROTEIN: ankyrin repeat domain-containing protein 13D-like n=1 Tax=Saccoglossus kowalevskii TaxID=10224 RepID=A0ABM0MDK3_SACKO|nr:PREDICTED: LOW QUALITY PROTEIN: ankyrin repeat domain-containing protein 13D-like [Saccoglossus kowalevskii]